MSQDLVKAMNDLYGNVSFSSSGGGGGGGTCSSLSAASTGLGILSASTAVGAAIPSPATPALTVGSIGLAGASMGISAYSNAIGCNR